MRFLNNKYYKTIAITTSSAILLTSLFTGNTQAEEKPAEASKTQQSPKTANHNELEQQAKQLQSQSEEKQTNQLLQQNANPKFSRDASVNQLSRDSKGIKQANTQANQTKNKYPIVFVHGFAGLVGEDRPSAIYPNYWGGDKSPLMETLRNSGYEVYDANIGPFSSNYDRAVELYYYIKGGTVDYGAAHAKKYGHARYGRTYEGVYPDWKPGDKIHLIGHSMGGQTSRLLENMLRHGNQEEIQYQKEHGGKISPLFKGQKDHMVSSMTTLATPHNGTYASEPGETNKKSTEVLYNIATFFGHKGSKVNLGFDHWGLRQRDDETYLEYADRVNKSKLWNTKDNSFYDLSPEGSRKLNEQTTTNPEIAYSSYAGEASHPNAQGDHVPDMGMYFLGLDSGKTIGKNAPEQYKMNDGLVPTRSAFYPEGRKHTTDTSTIKKGTWQVFPVKKDWDHFDLIGLDTLDLKRTPKELENFYQQLAERTVKVEQQEDK
ncbi:triacylglycerol lipase [Staphylococcus massiliensis]|uniref:YSIRK-targeted triacylglycerol lipase n=1 Tax=Staphylococcus massiliensis TaxID=555791 RepID=UPI001EDE3278|nr:triacylglycerol lipase [Staphylococcus massiliensis]MCG3401144.1 triacylglycerol lipase [Staphylococcus massiliensis]